MQVFGTKVNETTFQENEETWALNDKVLSAQITPTLALALDNLTMNRSLQGSGFIDSFWNDVNSDTTIATPLSNEEELEDDIEGIEDDINSLEVLEETAEGEVTALNQRINLWDSS